MAFMARVAAGTVAEVGLPAAARLADGRWVSNYAALPADTLTAEGWVPVVDDPAPAYNPHVQALSATYTVAADGASVTRSWTVQPHESRRPVQWTNDGGVALPTVELYVAKATGHRSFILNGDTSQKGFVCCPNAPVSNAKCDSFALTLPATNDAAGAADAATANTKTAIALIDGMKAKGCPVHDTAPAPSAVDQALALLTPEQLAAAIEAAFTA